MAFSLYSRIPVPAAQWNEKSMRYCICFLPAVGAVIGLAQAVLFSGLTRFAFGPVFRGALLCVCPVLLSGGIHVDGFLDTCDAIHSYGSREKRLEILKDPHVGAFAVVGGIVYFALSFAVWSEAQEREIPALCLVFLLSRAMSAFAAVVFPKAKKDGMLVEETNPAVKGTAAAMAAVTAAAGAAMLWLDPFPAAAGLVAALLTLGYYRHLAISAFGGTTGDLSGWFTQMCELTAAAAIVVTAVILRT
ncbi:MAG: adenosylcobinamide-GDP ribazoletransferase [Eubacteriales bacterium]|nr:adenosylcobinamide-GDP ribazoletransferase [Eubacteriales bacterium]